MSPLKSSEGSTYLTYLHFLRACCRNGIPHVPPKSQRLLPNLPVLIAIPEMMHSLSDSIRGCCPFYVLSMACRRRESWEQVSEHHHTASLVSLSFNSPRTIQILKCVLYLLLFQVASLAKSMLFWRSLCSVLSANCARDMWENRELSLLKTLVLGMSQVQSHFRAFRMASLRRCQRGLLDSLSDANAAFSWMLPVHCHSAVVYLANLSLK